MNTTYSLKNNKKISKFLFCLSKFFMRDVMGFCASLQISTEHKLIYVYGALNQMQFHWDILLMSHSVGA